MREAFAPCVSNIIRWRVAARKHAFDLRSSAPILLNERSGYVRAHREILAGVVINGFFQLAPRRGRHRCPDFAGIIEICEVRMIRVDEMRCTGNARVKQ